MRVSCVTLKRDGGNSIIEQKNQYVEANTLRGKIYATIMSSRTTYEHVFIVMIRKIGEM